MRIFWLSCWRCIVRVRTTPIPVAEHIRFLLLPHGKDRASVTGASRTAGVKEPSVPDSTRRKQAGQQFRCSLSTAQNRQRHRVSG